MVTEVNKGYVKYEVGEFPEDWVLKNFNDIFSFHSTSNYSKAEMSSEGSVGCIHYGLIHAIPNTHYDLSDGIKFYVTKEQAKYDYVRDGDVIMVDASEDISGVNKSVEVFGVGEGKYISGLHTYLIRDSKSNMADRFRGIILNSTVIKNQMIQLAVGMKVFGVSKTQLINIKIPLPPTLEEQKSIATALSDIDELITGLEKLISKKKDIKQGAAQALLSGKIRLNGFGHANEMKESQLGLIPKDWDVKLLPEVFDYIHGKAHEQHIDSSGAFTVVNSKFISSEGKVSKQSSNNFCPAKKGDILTVLSDLPNGKALAKTYYVNVNMKYAVNQRICIWRSKKDYPLFLSYIMNRHKYFMKFDDGVTQTHILNHHIEKCPVLVPLDINEQKAIAISLNDMVAEITQLETKKEKYQAIKQGMMQELLTGKTRLV